MGLSRKRRICDRSTAERCVIKVEAGAADCWDIREAAVIQLTQKALLIPGRQRVSIGGLHFPSRGRAGSAGFAHWTVRRYLRLIAAAALLALTGCYWYGFSWAADHDRDAAVRQLRFESTRSAQALDGALAEAKSTVDQLDAQSGLDGLFGSRPGACDLTASELGPFHAVRLDIVAADGHVVCSSGKSPDIFRGAVHRGSDWLRVGLASPSATVATGGKDAVTGQSAMVVTAAVKSAAGRSVGAIGLFVAVVPTATALSNEYAGSQQSTFFLVDGTSGTVLSTSLRGSEAAPVLGHHFSESRSGEWSSPGGSRFLVSSSPVANTNWRAYVGVPSSEALAAAHGALLRGGLVGAVSAVFLLLGLLIVNRQVAGPLRTVTDAVVRAGSDPGTARIKPAGTAELVTLAREVNLLLDVRAGFEAQLRHQASHDPLTGLPNAVLLRDHLEQALNRSLPGRYVAVLCLGIDRFRTLNDAMGPDATDRVLVEVADRLSGALQPGEFIARYGSDQFVVVCGAIRAVDHAIQVGARMRALLDQPCHPAAEPVAVSSSVGISWSGTRGAAPSAPQLLRESDSALHQAKVTGRGWALFDKTQQARATHYLSTEHALRQAIDGGELVIHYQPVMEVSTGRLAGAEALVRWQHPGRGLVPPMEFIPVAEETGQINEIGAFVLAEACAEAARWTVRDQPLTVSVNVVVGQLSDPGFVGDVRRALTAANLPADRLCLEVTESAMMRAAGPEARVLNALRALGVRLAIDDFGTGYSSLSYLHELPVDELKIDRSFISRMLVGNRDAHLVEAIMGMAHALGLDVVAEGVETTEQLELLARLGCQRAQGHLFLPAVPAESLRNLAADGRLQPRWQERSVSEGDSRYRDLYSPAKRPR
jgi:diguanylate cyclase (GGDEF)-like protein